MPKRENKYQPGLIKRIEARFPGCLILKNDEQYLQGIPDLTVLTDQGWAVLETKAGEKSSKRPNQEHYVQRLSELGFSAFINPSNEEEVLDAIQRSFETDRKSRSSEP